INIFGLAVGIACCTLIMLYIRDELSFDDFYPDADRIYRVATTITLPEQPVKHMAVSPPTLAPAIAADIPEIVASTRLLAYFEAAIPGRAAVSRDQSEFYDRFFWADPDFLDVFGHEVVAGNPETFFTEPYTVVITHETARRYFGEEDAIDQILTIDNGYNEAEHRVVGVLADPPGNVHFGFDVLASINSLENLTDERVMLDEWWDSDCYTYIKLAEGSDVDAVEAKFWDVIAKAVTERGAEILGAYTIPLTDVHLHSQLQNEIEPNSDITYVYIFGVVALVILLVACINFMNLSTARSANRAREVGLRKVMGAHRGEIIVQFFGESMLIAFLALAVSLIFVWIGLPPFNDFVGKDLSLVDDPTAWLAMLGITVFAGLVAGSYPALFLSSFRPIQVLAGALASGARGGLFRRVLVISQFAFSVMLIIGTAIIWDQLSYMRNASLGVDMDNVLVLPVRDSTIKDRYLTIKERIEQVPNVEGTAFSALMMGKEAPDLGTLGPNQDEWKLLGSLIVDQDWADFYDLEVLHGRNFRKENGEADMNAFVLTETGARELGYDPPEEAIGAFLKWGGHWREGNVIGVVKDFHYQPLRFRIKPVILVLRPIAYHFMAVRLGDGDLDETLNGLRSTWKEVFPGRPFQYSFLRDEFDRMYEAEDRLGRAIALFSMVAVFLGCLGLLGLASYTAEQRTQEIGIRKALGASTPGVVVLLSKEFGRLIVVAVLIAWPVIFLVMRRWLEDFAYRTELNIGYFVLGGLLAFAIAAVTVSFQAMRAAMTNPATALRYE
ncbi:MAG: ABC transporter permease, partial [Acidobacteriota bacterium]